MIHYEKLRPLIFQNQKSIEKYGIDYRGSINSALYDELNKVKGLRQEKPSNIGCDQLFLDIFNDVYFIITLIFMFKRPEHHIEDVYLVIAKKGNQSKNMIRTWAVMGMVLAMLKHLNKCSFIHLPEGDKFIKRIEDAIQVWFDEGDETKRNVAQKMCEAVFSVNMLIDKNVFFPIPLTSNFLKRINWGQYITLFDFDAEFSSSYIGSNDVEELLLFLGRFTQEKYNVVLSLMEYVKNMCKKDNREPVVVNYEGALAHLEFYEQKWHPKKDSPTVEELTAPKQLVFPELQYLYSGETLNDNSIEVQVPLMSDSEIQLSKKEETPKGHKLRNHFCEYIRNKEQTEEIIGKLHRLISNKKNTAAADIIKEAMWINLIDRPTIPSIKKEFPTITCSTTPISQKLNEALPTKNGKVDEELLGKIREKFEHA